MSAETQYCRFTDDDNDIWAKCDKTTGQVEVLGEVWYRMGSAMRNEMQRQSIVARILQENGIIINTKTQLLPPPDYSWYTEWTEKHPEDQIFTFSPDDKPSKDGVIYKYFIMPDEGRGGGLILKKTGTVIEVIAEDHIDNMTDHLVEFAEELGIDLKTKYAYEDDIDLIGFKPTPKDF